MTWGKKEISNTREFECDEFVPVKLIAVTRKNISMNHASPPEKANLELRTEYYPLLLKHKCVLFAPPNHELDRSQRIDLWKLNSKRAGQVVELVLNWLSPIIFLWLARILNWRVWSWLRTNAGGVLNTCKSNAKGTSVMSRVAHGWVTRR